MSRFVSIWFRHLQTDWYTRQHPDMKEVPFVFTMPIKGRACIIAANEQAERAGITVGMVLADARTLEPAVQNIEGKDGFNEKLLNAIAGYSVRYSPKVALMPPDGLTIDASGCSHLWGGEAAYLKAIVTSLRAFGYDARAAMADTVGASWAVARYGMDKPIVPVGCQRAVLAKLPPAALRIDAETVKKLKNLGLRKIEQLYDLPRSTLIRRFGNEISRRLSEAVGELQEHLLYKAHHDPYVENLMTPEGVASAEGIAAALTHLLVGLCHRLSHEHKGVRYLVFDCFRVDGKVETVEIGTSRPSRSPKHLFKLFENKLDKIEPALGIEQFRLTASQVETVSQSQNSLLGNKDGLDDSEVREMVDRLGNRFDQRRIYCFVPLERHWPENAVKDVPYSDAPRQASWRKNPLRPINILREPEIIEVTAPVPDYPPMFFRHQNRLHRVCKADGPERIEREWWLNSGMPRDYFKLEDETGQRYWVFRDGQYDSEQPPRWFLHGYFA